MKLFLTFVFSALIVFGESSFAANLKCADEAVEAATVANYRKFGASGGSCGAKLLTHGDYTETYLVCVSDETDPSEWVVVVDKPRSGKPCAIQYAGAQYDSESPNFVDPNGGDPSGLLKTKECSVSDDGSGRGKVICK